MLTDVYFIQYFDLQGANEGGKNYGDEYLAELDYVEAVEGIKDGYESDVVDPEPQEDEGEENKEKSTPPSEEEDEDTAREACDSDEDFNGRWISCSTDPATSIR